MKSPGQILRDKIYPHADWSQLDQKGKEFWEESANAVLENQWRSVDDPPAFEDRYEKVLLSGGDFPVNQSIFCLKSIDRTHWMRIPQVPKPKEPTPLELAQKEFEDAFPNLNLNKYEYESGLFKNEYLNDTTRLIWGGFKAAKGLV